SPIALEDYLDNSYNDVPSDIHNLFLTQLAARTFEIDVPKSKRQKLNI
ncbi:2989_t:CDS:1, partial [Dentiscutata erythropus]